MTDAPIVVGINRTQDASICVAGGDGALMSFQKERITRRKHHWGRLGDLRDLYFPRVPELHQPVDLVVECFSSDAEVANLDAYEDELRQTLRFRDEPRITRISHHWAHLCSAFPTSPFGASAVMVIDAQGSRAGDCTEAFRLPAGVDPQMLEIASFYRADGNRFECIAKQVWDGDWDAPVGLGCFYYLLTRMLFPVGEGNEGKVMGLAPFGEVHAMAMPELVVEGHAVFIPSEWVKLFNERERYQYSDDPRSFRASADLAAEGQHAFEEALLRVAQWLHQQTGDENLCFAGGTALNCSANGRLMREGPFGGLFIPPSTHDGGTAVGCAVHGLVNELGVQSSFRWRHDFLGPQHAENEARDAVSHAGDDVVVEQPDDLVATVVDLLEDGHVVGVCHQRSESGPRALGNRSILADARRPDMQDFINSRVKGREWFRPLAPIVLAEAASTVFCIDRPSPFMQFAARVRPEHAAALPAITHVDGSARLQTVDSETTPMLRAILELFASRTGCPVLLNTSLNGKGDPIVETPDEALACLRSTAMHALVIPPFVVRKVAG